VRKFIADLLVATRDLPENEARAIADNWKLGTGDELWTYPTHMFKHLFGVEEGWTVYREVKVIAERAWLEERKANPQNDTILRERLTLIVWSPGQDANV
jgi:hypothetical protein